MFLKTFNHDHKDIVSVMYIMGKEKYLLDEVL